MKTPRSVGVVLLVALAASACAGMKFYVEPDVPSEQIALIEAPQQLVGTRLYIRSADGERLSLGGEPRVKVLPGVHTLEVRYEFHWLGAVRYGQPISLSMNAEAGRRYRVEGAETGGGRCMAWIVDTATNEVVGGRRP